MMAQSSEISRGLRAIIFFIIFVFVCRNSLYTDDLPIIHYAFSAMRFACWAIVLMLYFRSPQRIDALGFFMLLYGVVVTYSSFTMQSDSKFSVLSIGFDVFMIWCLFRLYLPQCAQLILESFITSLAVCIYINFILLLLYPNGIRGWFLLGGNYNQMGRTLIPAIAIHGFYTLQYGKKKLSFIALSTISLLTVLYVGSKTSTVGLVLLLIFYFVRSAQIRKWIFISFISVYIIFQIFTVFMPQDLSENEYITYFVEEVLHKDLTFTNRSTVWAKTILLIADSPIYGYGHRAPDWFSNLLHVKTTHNQILHVLIMGGFIALSIFITQIVLAIKSYAKNRNIATQFLFFGLCTFFFMMIMETYNYTYIALLLLILYNIKDFVSNYEETIEQQPQ